MATAPSGGAPVKLPSKIVDISQSLDNETVVDADFMRPSIRDVTGKEDAKLMCELFPGLREEELPTFSFTVARFSCKIKATSGGWTRAVALFD